MRSRLINSLAASMLLLAVRLSGQSTVADSRNSSRATPVGRWKTVDDVTGKVNSVVVIWEENGKLYGKIEKLVNPDPDDPDPRCVRCQGAMRDQPLIGLRILWDLRKDGEQ